MGEGARGEGCLLGLRKVFPCKSAYLYLLLLFLFLALVKVASVFSYA